MTEMKKILPIGLFLALISQSIFASDVLCEKEWVGYLGAAGEKLQSDPAQFYDAFNKQKAIIALIIDGEFQDQIQPSDHPLFETPLYKCVSNAITNGDLIVADSDKSIARKAYLSYRKKVRFTEIITTIHMYKTAVSSCYSGTKNFYGCNAGTNGIPKSVGKITGNETVNGKNPYSATRGSVIAGVKVEEGVITVEAISGKGFSGEVYILTPTITISGEVNWIVSGSCESIEVCN
jgi:type IV pilus assembly protein PilA